MQAVSGPSQETRVGVRLGCSGPRADGGSAESSGVSDSAWWGGSPRPRGWKLQAALLAERQGRREAPDGL